ncbi:histidinol dehydrogenase [Muriicola jejuensis]|uniref:Histidinol dehydrogenase n=1 Tax=Muriicola jejuensis TaxID=504488 RepID=A0A6P0UD80_9FLAO|nr:histidinol dehydrogenase [Muriicola jejuensis]NER11231.1 histidinol dehydrogenase [Muriicola jejuensis]SMP21901.1 histidinol dehydrogenase [Muriicola jejuensis]
MKKYFDPQKIDWEDILSRPTRTFGDIEETVNEVFKAVRRDGDKAVREYTLRFDGVSPESMAVQEEELMEAEGAIDGELKNAIRRAYDNIYKFHKAQKTSPVEVETSPGVICWQQKKPIQKVGLYIPGGTAPLFSTILMLAIPAKIAGCKEIVLCSPPDKSGNLHPAVLYTAALCGITRVFKVGGIQAVAAMAFGTESIPKVFKIFGPGNQYVTVAKQLATRYGVAIDMPAGPSELLVLADDTAIPSFVAADLLSQAEHGADSQVVLVTTSRELLQKVEKEVGIQLGKLPRKDLAEKAIDNSRLIYVSSRETAIDLINEYGPEHFILCTAEEEYYLENTINAGSVFIGNYTPESAGDYASGTNHTLPTNGYAKQYSGVNLDSFTKSITYQKISEKGIMDLGETIEVMAAAEGLQGHKNAVTIRKEYLRQAIQKVG